MTARPHDPTRPLVTVGVPVFDGAAYLDRALASIVAQDGAALEVIVADNASTDGTRDIAERYARSDPRVTYLGSDRNRGAAWNFNRLVAVARGRYFKWAAHDDELLPGHLERCLEVLEARPGTVLAYPRTVLIDTASRVVGDFEDGLDLAEAEPHRRLGHLLRSQTEYHPVFGVVRTDVLRATRLIDRFPGSDVALLAELALAGAFSEIPERLFARRFHPGTSMRANPSAEERAAWFDPANRRRRVWPTARLGWEMLRSVQRADLESAERARCLLAVARHWAVPRWRTIGGEVKSSVVARAGAGRRLTGGRPVPLG